MSKYSNDTLAKMGYLYLVKGLTQREIESRLGLPAGAVSTELKPFGITGSENNSGRGYGQKGNHSGIASYENMGFKVTVSDVHDWMFNKSGYMTDAEYFAALKKQHAADFGDDMYGTDDSYYDGGGAGTGSVLGGFISAMAGRRSSGRTGGSSISSKGWLFLIVAILVIIFRRQIISFVFAVAPYVLTIVIAVFVIKWLLNLDFSKLFSGGGSGAKRGRRKTTKHFDAKGLIPAAILWIIGIGGFSNGAGGSLGSTLLGIALLLGGVLCVYHD